MSKGGDIGILSRVIGAAIGAGGAWLALMFVSWQPGMPVQAGIAAAMGIAGFAFGPKVWEAVASLA